MMTEITRKKRIIITMEICRNIRRQIELQKSLRDISKINDLSYNSVLVIDNKISQGMSDIDIVQTKKGRKVNEESHVRSYIK